MFRIPRLWKLCFMLTAMKARQAARRRYLLLCKQWVVDTTVAGWRVEVEMIVEDVTK